jgi:isopenicillin-N N-acyltransferase-like protein
MRLDRTPIDGRHSLTSQQPWVTELGDALGIRCHRSTEVSAYDRGLALGAAHADAVGNTVSFYRAILAEDFELGVEDLEACGIEVRRAVAALGYGGMVEEIEGIADGAGCSRDVLLAINARTELIAGGRYAAAPGGAESYRGPRLVSECSAIGALPEVEPDGHCLLAQNWDFHPDLRPSRLLWLVEQGGGRWLCTFTEAGILAKCGLNSAGVAATMNFLATDDDGGLGGLPIHLLVRAALEHAEDWPGALRIFTKTPVTASSNFNVAFGDPDAPALCSAEVTPRGTRIVEPDGGLLVHTNHFLDPGGITDLMLSEHGGPDTLVRRDDLLRILAGGASVGVRDVMDALSIHDNAPASVCTHRDTDEYPWIKRVGTLASVVIDATTRSMWLAAGQPCQTPFQRIPLSVGTPGPVPSA